MNSNTIAKISLFLLFKDSINEVENNFNNSLYSKAWIEIITPENIRKNRETAYSFECIEQRKRQIKDFLKSNDIKIKVERDISNAFEKFIICESINFDCNLSFSDLSDDDKIRLSRGYMDLFPDDSFISVLYYPVSNDWEYIKGFLCKRGYTVVSDFILDFSGNVPGFKNLIHDIYNDYDCDSNSLIQKKIDLLINSKLIVKVIILSKNLPNVDLYNELGTIKLELRDILNYTTNKNTFLNMHTPENAIENDHLKHVLVSVNNLWYVNNRIRGKFESEFIEKIHVVQEELLKKSIDKMGTTVISTGAMEAVGIWKCNDIDLISLLKFDDSENIDFFNEEYNCHKYAQTNVRNQAIITDDNNYFYVFGMKFANLKFIKERILLSNEKEISQKKIRCINAFYDFVQYVDDKNILENEIQLELQRRLEDQRKNSNILKRVLRKFKRLIKSFLHH